MENVGSKLKDANGGELARWARHAAGDVPLRLQQASQPVGETGAFAPSAQDIARVETRIFELRKKAS